MMKRRLGDAPAGTVSLAVFRTFERDDEIEGAPSDLAATHRDDPSAFIASRHTDPALMRMRREEPYTAAGRSLSTQQRMKGIDRRNHLKIAVSTGMVIRP